MVRNVLAASTTDRTYLSYRRKTFLWVWLPPLPPVSSFPFTNDAVSVEWVVADICSPLSSPLLSSPSPRVHSSLDLLSRCGSADFLRTRWSSLPFLGELAPTPGLPSFLWSVPCTPGSGLAADKHPLDTLVLVLDEANEQRERERERVSSEDTSRPASRSGSARTRAESSPLNPVPSVPLVRWLQGALPLWTHAHTDALSGLVLSQPLVGLAEA